jgi:hypothetical protein
MRWHFPDLKFRQTPFVDRISRHYHKILTHPRCLIRYPDNFTNRILQGVCRGSSARLHSLNSNFSPAKADVIAGGVRVASVPDRLDSPLWGFA